MRFVRTLANSNFTHNVKRSTAEFYYYSIRLFCSRPAEHARSNANAASERVKRRKALHSANADSKIAYALWANRENRFENILYTSKRLCLQC